MCGIAGIVALAGAAPPTHEAIVRMSDAMVHRGPDDSGVVLRGAVGFGMRRLSIIDVAGGRQPIFNEDGSVSVVFNGEIYNFRELRRDLEARGHRFATASDTEVIVHLYEEVGPDFPRHLNGMFAIAIHDGRQGRVLLARDHLGIKPLFHARVGDHVVFGSEVKVLLASGLIEPRLDLDSLGQFLAWEYVPAPATLLKGVRKLEPGCLLEIGLAAATERVTRYWDVPGPVGPSANGSLPRTEREWEDAVDAKLRECVRRQLVSDVPLGAFLSGGVDSSLVAAAMGPGARTFSIGFDDPTYNEVPWSQRVARHLGVDHTVEVIRPDVAGLFDRLMHFMDDPIGDFSIFPTYLVSRLAREHVTVALSGDGGDELFGGYETYLAQEMARAWTRVPAPLRRGLLEPAIRSLGPREAKKGLINKARRFVEGFDHEPALGHARWRVFVGESMRSALFTPDAAAALATPVAAHVSALLERAAPRDPADRALYADVRSYLVDNCLVKVDRMSMACSLETRVPFLDPELVELAFAMPARLKFDRGRTKILLKRIAARHVPRECVYRPKEGFSIPIKHWLRTGFRPLLQELLAPDRIREAGLFDPDFVQRLVREHLDDRENHSHVLWSLLVFEDWRRRWGVTA